MMHSDVQDSDLRRGVAESRCGGTAGEHVIRYSDLRVDFVVEAVLALEGLLDVATELGEGDLVAVLVLAEVLGLLLHGVVRQVDEAVVEVLERELSARGPHVPLVVPVA